MLRIGTLTSLSLICASACTSPSAPSEPSAHKSTASSRHTQPLTSGTLTLSTEKLPLSGWLEKEDLADGRTVVRKALIQSKGAGYDSIQVALIDGDCLITSAPQPPSPCAGTLAVDVGQNGTPKHFEISGVPRVSVAQAAGI